MVKGLAKASLSAKGLSEDQQEPTVIVVAGLARLHITSCSFSFITIAIISSVFVSSLS